MHNAACTSSDFLLQKCNRGFPSGSHTKQPCFSLFFPSTFFFLVFSCPDVSPCSFLDSCSFVFPPFLLLSSHSEWFLFWTLFCYLLCHRSSHGSSFDLFVIFSIELECVVSSNEFYSFKNDWHSFSGLSFAICSPTARPMAVPLICL